jgi:hypothetical protein
MPAQEPPKEDLPTLPETMPASHQTKYLTAFSTVSANSGRSRTLLRFDPGAADRKSSDRQQLVVSSASMANLALSVVLGVALAAATGFRVFLPMLIASSAAYSGYLHLDDGFAWLGSPSALFMLSVAALVEVLAYYVPVIDNLLDVVSAPAAFIAGTILSAAVMTDMSPMVKWTAAVIAGGGVAGLTRGSIGVLRAHSTVLTGGLGNFLISTAELGGAALISFLALAAPIAAIALVALFLYVAMRLLRRLLGRAKPSNGRT